METPRPACSAGVNDSVTLFVKFASGRNDKTNTKEARLILPRIAARRIAAAGRAARGANLLLGKRACAAVLGLLAVLAPDALESAAANGDTRTIYLYHAHRKGTIAATFRVKGYYDA